MKKRWMKNALGATIIALVGVFVVDYIAHLFFSDPMETFPYFLAKLVLFFLFSFAFLSLVKLDKKEFLKVVIGGIIVSSLWGLYYNVFPEVFGYYPFGLSLYDLAFLGMGDLGTGAAFGTVHTIAFVFGYYVSKKIFGKIK